MLEKFKKFEIQKTETILGGCSTIGGDLEINTNIRGGSLD